MAKSGGFSVMVLSQLPLTIQTEADQSLYLIHELQISFTLSRTIDYLH